MVRLLIAAAVFAVLARAAPLAASVYTGATTLAARSVDAARPAATLFPGVLFGDPTDHFVDSGNLSVLLSKVNELFRSRENGERQQTVASLYGDGDTGQNRTAENGSDDTIPVIVDISGNQPPIQVFTGADTTKILTQLFSGILDVND